MLAQAVDIQVVSVKQRGLYFTALITEADTLSEDQSSAKIQQIKEINFPSNKNSTQIEYLLLWDLKTKTLPFGIFYNFPEIKKLVVTRVGQEMESPVSKHFYNAKKLKHIFISNQKFHNMGSNVFEGADAVKWIYLDNNQIDSIQETTFTNFVNLTEISLTSNFLTTIPSNSFSTLPMLEAVVLGKNLLTTIPSDVFAKNENLKFVDFEHNRFLFLENVELSQSLQEFRLMENLCVNDKFYDSEDLNEEMEKLCTIDIPPSEVFLSFKEHAVNQKLCKANDFVIVSELRNDIKKIEAEISIIETENLWLEEMLYNILELDFCYNYDESNINFFKMSF